MDGCIEREMFGLYRASVTQGMLEEMLNELKKAEKSESDRFALERLAQQRQICEKNLTSVRQNLADASKVVIVVLFFVLLSSASSLSSSLSSSELLLSASEVLLSTSLSSYLSLSSASAPDLPE